MIQFKNGQFQPIAESLVCPGGIPDGGSWDEGLKSAGFERWDCFGSEYGVEVIYWRRYLQELKTENWLIDINGVTGGFFTIYCESESDFAGAMIHTSGLLAPALLSSLTAQIEMAVEEIGMQRGDNYYSLCDLIVGLTKKFIH